MPGLISLPSQLDIKAAAPLAAELLALRGKDLTLDASAVEQLGGQCIQVLLSAAATWAADGAELAVREPSAAFLEAAETAGLATSDFCTRNN
ncbi:STAS domain-containing protein [Aquamicrobium sp. LC103]|nr:STAS domain-containing protein [Aquamicrobium sp. LC103]